MRGTLEGEQDIRYEDLRVEGWETGIAVPEAGHHVIVGGYFNNARSIVIPTPMQRGRRVEIVGDVRIGNFDPQRLGKAPQYDIDLETRFAPLLDTGGGYRDPNVLFASDVTMLSVAGRPVRQLYFPEQAAGRVVFPRQAAPGDFKKMGRAEGGVPEALIEKTNGELWSKYGLAVGGAVAPADAAPAPRIHALLGNPAHYSEDLRLSAVRTAQLAAYQPVCLGAQKQSIAMAPLDLQRGWNLVTQTIDRQPHSFLLFAGDMPAAAKNKPGKY